RRLHALLHPRLVLRAHALGERIYLTATLHFIGGPRKMRSRFAIDSLRSERAVLREVLERGVGQQTPKLVHPTNQSSPVQQLAHEMKQVQSHGRARELMIQEFRDVESDDGVRGQSRYDTIGRVVEDPRILPLGALAPAR